MSIHKLKLVAFLQEQGITSQQVLDNIEQIPREIFVGAALSHKAYENTALPIGHNQTLSQPYIVARMTELLFEPHAPQKVLEIGTGSGYQTALLAKMVKQVFSIERIADLQWQARQRFRRLDLFNISLKHGDGWQGWQTQAPFDGIIVTAAATEVPQALVDQLAIGGKMIIPIGQQEQVLFVIEKTATGVTQTAIEAVRFVPLIAGNLA